MKLRTGSRRMFGSMTLLASLALVAGACGSSNNSNNATGTTAATTAAPTAGSATTAASTETSATASSAPGSTATGSSAASNADWDAIVAKAKDEGKVTIYSSQGLDQLNDMAKRFKDQYGITVEVVRGIDSELIPKVEAENKTGKGIADVFAQAGAAWSKDKGAQGWFIPATGPAFDDPAFNKAENMSADGSYFTSSAAILTFGWNTQLFKKGLKDYPDLLDPSLSGGKVGVIEPSAPSIVDFWLYLEDKYGADFTQKLAAQKPKIYPSSLPMAQALTSGEIAAGSFVQVLTDEKAKGAPVDSGLSDTVWGARFNTQILKTAPHPNAAQVLANFMVTQPGQEAIARKAASVLPGIDGAVTDVSKVRKQDLSKLTPDFVTQYKAKWDAMFK
jgi:iron(III) transport system substrate-binding protein